MYVDNLQFHYHIILDLVEYNLRAFLYFFNVTSVRNLEQYNGKTGVLIGLPTQI